MNNKKNDFTKGSVARNIINLAVPMTLAQLINVLYNIVDRFFIGRIPQGATLAMSGLGLSLPIITIVIAFANLFGMGGAPLCSIARGKGNEQEAEEIMGNSFALMIIFGLLLTVLGLLFKKPMLYLFGASHETFPYANDYLSIYLLGSIFVMIGLGMNSFINSQGFAKIGMMTVLIGAVTNMILDPLFIFQFHLGVKGAALATILSQFISAAWIIIFLTGNNTILKLRFSRMKLKIDYIKQIIALGMSGFVMAITNSLVSIVCNASLQSYGGDLYVAAMTIINSIREVVSMPSSGLTNASQPVLGYNYGAKCYQRVLDGIKFMTVVCVTYTFIMWLFITLFPNFFIHIFNNDPELVQVAVPSLKIYFFGFFMMSFQFSGQSVAVALGKSKQAIFFSLLRKVFIVVPLTLLLPKIGFGINGIFLAEPISNFIGGGACYITMWFTIGKDLQKEARKTA